MRNITVAVSDKTYAAARIWAATNQTSVSAIVQVLLDTLPTMPPIPDAGKRIAEARRLALDLDQFADESAQEPVFEVDSFGRSLDLSFFFPGSTKTVQ
jgi:hypothetical protein